MKSPRRFIFNVAIPSILLLMLLCVMVGCIYIPTFDHTILSGSKQDFRGFASDQDSMPTAKLAKFSREEIESMFGKPPFVSQDERCVAYVMGTENGITIWPLCFGAGFENGDTQVLKLVYDDNMRLKRVHLYATYRQPQMYWFGSKATTMDPDPMANAKELLADLDGKCPDDEVIEFPAPNSRLANPGAAPTTRPAPL